MGHPLELPKYRPDIDGLRALAVIAVIGFHAFPDAVPGGFTGVDVFFVVSGYLISMIVLGNVERGRFTFAEFYARRIKRLFPALALVLLATLALGWLALFAGEFAQLGKHVAAGAGFVSNFVLWREAGYFDAAAETKPLLHLWSLGVEEQFYIVWPALLWLGCKGKRGLGPAIAALALLSFALCLWLVGEDPAAAFFAPFTRLWELLLGALLAQRAMRGPAIPGNGTLPALADLRSWVGLALVAFGVVATSRDTPFPSAWTLAPALGTCLIISAGPGAWLNRHVLRSGPLVGIGLISYPLYLWHWPLLSFARIVEGATPPPGIRLAVVLGSFILAWLTYRWVERPIRFGGGLAAWPGATVTVLCALMLCIGGAGYEVFRHNGIEWRDAARAQSINRFDPPYGRSCTPLMEAATGRDACNNGSDPSSPPEVVLIGDSFAYSYAPMVAALLADIGPPHRTFRQFGRVQCPLLVDYGPPYCREITRRAMAFIATTSSVRTVVLASSWSLYEGGKPEVWGAYAEPPEAFAAALGRTVRMLRDMAKNPVVLLAPPTGADPKACTARPVRLSGRDNCTLSTERARYLEHGYRARLLPRLEMLSVAYFDPFEYLCDGTTCRMTDGKLILSIDGFHLSVHGAEFLARKARAPLAALLKL